MTTSRNRIKKVVEQAIKDAIGSNLLPSDYREIMSQLSKNYEATANLIMDLEDAANKKDDKSTLDYLKQLDDANEAVVDLLIKMEDDILNRITRKV